MITMRKLSWNEQRKQSVNVWFLMQVHCIVPGSKLNDLNDPNWAFKSNWQIDTSWYPLQIYDADVAEQCNRSKKSIVSFAEDCLSFRGLKQSLAFASNKVQYHPCIVCLANLRPFHLMTLTPNLYGLRNYLDLILRFDTTLALASVPEVNWGGLGIARLKNSKQKVKILSPEMFISVH